MSMLAYKHVFGVVRQSSPCVPGLVMQRNFLKRSQEQKYHDARFARYVGEGTHATTKPGFHTLLHASCHLQSDVETTAAEAFHSKEQSASQHPTCQCLGKESAETCTASLFHPNELLNANHVLHHAHEFASATLRTEAKHPTMAGQALLLLFRQIALVWHKYDLATD